MSLIGWIALGVIVALVLLFIYLPVVAWTLVGLVLLILALVLFVPIGADVGYVDKVFKLAVRADGFALQLLPKKPQDPNKPPKEEKPKPKKEEPPKEEKPKEEKPKKKLSLNFTKEEIFELIKRAINGLGKFGKLTVRKFMLHFTAGGIDPYNTAMSLGYVNWALSTLAPICARKFKITCKPDVWTDANFIEEFPSVEFEISVTLRLIQVVRMALAVGWGVVVVLIKNKLRLRREAKLAKQNGTESVIDKQSETTPDIEIQKEKSEERNDSHGE